MSHFHSALETTIDELQLPMLKQLKIPIKLAMNDANKSHLTTTTIDTSNAHDTVISSPQTKINMNTQIENFV